MEEYVVTSEGVKMPKIIYGTAWKKERTEALVVQAVKAGFRGIDTACQPKHYEEALVGKALKALAAEGIVRESLYVQTKFTPLEGQDPKRIPYDPSAPLAAQVVQSFERSLENLQTKYVDALVLHSPLFPFKNLMSVWRAMEERYRSGGARQLGISNCYELPLLKRLYEEAGVKPALVQNRFYDASGYDAELRAWCAERGIVYQSFWTLTANPHLLGSDTLLRLAFKYRKSPPQILFAYLSGCGVVPLSGTTSPEHMHEDLSSFDVQLEEAESAAVTALLR